ncbi:MAG TPA: outer membrane protein assembly factor BamD [Phycisphaerae bacterium]|nr:outer membrane protein assembly factor BamD [Phycisphaerae bacterium]
MRILCMFCVSTWIVVVPCARAEEDELIWDGKEWTESKPADPGTPRGDLAAIRELITHAENKDTVKAVERFLVEHGDSPACEEAMNLAGQALINRGRYWDAYKWFERQISSYPNGAFFERALDREYLIADAFLNGRKRRAMKIFRVPAADDGIEILTRISVHAPGTKIAERSLLRVADFHFHRAEYAEAVNVYDDFIKSHPQSDRRQYAMLQAAKSFLLSFRGVKWDDATLLDARKRFEVFAQAFPRTAERENIAGILEEIRLTLAHKVYHTGRFYERTKHHQAAAFYYQKVMRQYPDTHWAQSARGRLERLGPIEPTDRTPQAYTALLQTEAKKPPEVAPPSPPKQKDEEERRKGPEPIRLEELTKD